MENSEKKEQRVNLGEIWYAIKKNWLIEIIIFVVILAAGFVYTRINKDYYVASGTIVVKASVESSPNNINNTNLSKQNVATVAQILQNSATMEKAGKPSGKLALTYSETNSAQTITMKFTSPTKDGAVEGLKAIYNAGREIIEEKDENGDQKYFSADVGIVLIGDQVNWTSQSNDMKILLLAFIGGIAAALVVTVLLYFINDKVSSVERVETLSGVKNLAVIEKVKNADSAEDYLKLDLKKLSDTLIYMEAGENKKVYQIQSAISGEGKSTVVANLAVALGMSQRKALIIDCDFSKPNIHRMFKLSKQTGITDYFKGEVDFDGMVKATGAENVDLITCGEVVGNHTIFFASKKFEEIINTAKEKYDFVLLDGAPIKAMSDYINLSKVSDGTILVVGNDKITSRDLDYSVRELEGCNANLVGTVFNFSQVSSKKRYYYYKYKNQ